MMDVSKAKETLRKRLMEVRMQVSPDQIETSSVTVWQTLHNLPAFMKANTIAAVSSFKGEIDTFRILDGMLHAKKHLCLPRITPDGNHLTFHEIQSLKDLTPGSFGILEPPTAHHIAYDQLDLVLVPGLAFDLHGKRIGFGKGYYDKVIPHLRKDCLTIGLCYSFQVVGDVPSAKHDVPVQALLTEQGFQMCRP